jgi:hypothetical protein
MHDYPDNCSFIARIGPRRAAVWRRWQTGCASGITRDAICAPMAADLRQRTAAEGTFAGPVLSRRFEYLTRRRSPASAELRLACWNDHC